MNNTTNRLRLTDHHGVYVAFDAHDVPTEVRAPQGGGVDAAWLNSALASLASGYEVAWARREQDGRAAIRVPVVRASVASLRAERAAIIAHTDWRDARQCPWYEADRKRLIAIDEELAARDADAWAEHHAAALNDAE